MKKLFVVLLAILVLSSVALIAVACGGEEETANTTAMEETTVPEEVTTTEAVSTALTPAEVLAIAEPLVADYAAAGEDAVLAEYNAGEVTFAGPVLKISEKADKYIISIGDETTSFPCALYKTDLEKFGYTADSLNAMVGMNLEITGDVVLNPFGSAAEIVLTDPAQVVVK